MSARTDESAPLRVFWAYADDGAPELRLGFPDERSPMRLRANGQIERVFYSDPCPDGPINVFGEHRDSVIFDAQGVVALLEAAGWACLPPPKPPRPKLALKTRDVELEWVARVLDQAPSDELKPGSYVSVDGRAGRLLAVRQCSAPALDLSFDYDLVERLEELALDDPHEDEFGVWDDQFIEIEPGAEQAWTRVWRNFAALYVTNNHHRVVAGDGPATPPDDERVLHVSTDKPRDDVFIVESAPDACHACGHESLTAGFGLAGGGMGSYWICDNCGRLHKAPEPPEED